ncbi:MAG: enoyl-CoA hydratase-related protein [Pusillimonas sp.]
MQYETLTCNIQPNGLLLVTLNRPQVHNAINTQMGKELRSLFLPLRFTPGDLRCIVITGEGSKSFSTGGDLKERKGMSEESWRLQHAIFEEAFYAVMDCSIPVIAAVNGFAYAGGCELALASDFIYASNNATFALTEASLGIIPGAGGTQNLPRAVGERRAKELIMSAKPFTAEQAKEWGMINEICTAEELLPTVLTLAERICANAPISVAQAKKAIHYGMQTDLKTGLMLEVQAYEKVIPSEDRKEGILAFNEKRRPQFTGR